MFRGTFPFQCHCSITAAIWVESDVKEHRMARIIDLLNILKDNDNYKCISPIFKLFRALLLQINAIKQ